MQPPIGGLWFKNKDYTRRQALPDVTRLSPDHLQIRYRFEIFFSFLFAAPHRHT